MNEVSSKSLFGTLPLGREMMKIISAGAVLLPAQAYADTFNIPASARARAIRRAFDDKAKLEAEVDKQADQHINDLRQAVGKVPAPHLVGWLKEEIARVNHWREAVITGIYTKPVEFFPIFY